MTFKTNQEIEITPAKPAETANIYRIRRLELDLGKADGSILPVFTIVVASGSMIDGVFQPNSRQRVGVTDLADIASLTGAMPNPGETVSECIERISFDYLLANGYVTAGSIEV